MNTSIVVSTYDDSEYLLNFLKYLNDQAIDAETIIFSKKFSSDIEKRIEKEIISDSVQRIVTEESVTDTRNRGIELASKDYILFLDNGMMLCDDVLNNMLLLTEEYDADLTVGEPRIQGTFTKNTMVNTRKLSRRSVISPDEPKLLYNTIISSNLFRRDIIEQQQLMFTDVGTLTDLAFILRFIKYSKTIIGFPRIVCAKESCTAHTDLSQMRNQVNCDELEQLLMASTMLGREVDEYSPSWSETFKTIIVQYELINRFYRYWWLLEEKTQNKLIEAIEQYRNLISKDTWGRICSNSEDLKIETGLRFTDDIVMDPMISVVIPSGLSEEELTCVINSLYGQSCPNFEVIISSAYSTLIPAWAKELPNLEISERDGLQDYIKSAKGEFLQIIDAPCIYEEKSLRLMSRRLVNSKKNRISVMTVGYNKGEYSTGILDESESNKLFASCLFRKNTLEEITNLSNVLSNKGEGRYYRNVKIGVSEDWLTEKGFSIINRKEQQSTNNLSSNNRANDTDLFEKVRRFLYRACCLLPVNRSKAFFLSDSRDSLGGNFAPLYQPLKEENFKIVCDFYSNKSPGESRRSRLKRAYELATAGFIVLEDVHPDMAWIRVRDHQEMVQLWHACGAYKRFGWSREGADETVYINPGYVKTTKAIVSAEEIRSDYAESFHIDISRVEATGIPRTDIFFDNEYLANVRASYDAKYPILKGKKILLFAPTYRGNFVSKAYYDAEMFDPEKVHEVLGDDWIIAFKWHPFHYKVMQKKHKTLYEEAKFEGYTIDLSEERDINDLLIIADVVISDYSSIIFEYELMNKPIIYYWYDVNNYKLERGMFYDLEEYVYGKVAYSFPQLLDALKDQDLCSDRRKAFHSKFMSACDGNSTNKVVQQIFKAN